MYVQASYLGRLALNAPCAGIVVFIHVVVMMVVPLSVLKVTLLQVSVDVEVVVHAVRLRGVYLFWEVPFQLLQFVLGEKVLLWKRHLTETTVIHVKVAVTRLFV